MNRQRLPNRRPSITDGIRWPIDSGRRIHVTAGFATEGGVKIVREVFLRGGGQVGSDRDFILDDVAVLISRSLQHGDSVTSLAKGISRLSTGEPASLIGAVLDALAKIEAEQ